MTNGFTEGAKKKPLIMAGVFSELNINGQDISDKDGLTREQRLERLKGVFADWTDTLVAAFNEAYPGRDELDLLRLDNLIRIISIDFVNKRAADGCAPTYDVMFTPNFSVENGSPAWHCSDLPFFFHNIDMIPVANGLPNARELEHQISGSLIQFAKTGDPNAEDLLRWPMYDLESKSTLVLDTHCRIGEAYDHKLYQIYTRWMGTKKSVWGYKKNDKTAGIT